MPRFNAEGTNQALMEMMRQQLLEKMMFNQSPLSQHTSKGFDNSTQNTLGSLNQLFGRQNPGPYDPVYGIEKFDDTKTKGQSAREDEEFGTAMRESRMQRIRPEQHNDPGSGSSFLDQLPPASALGMPPGSPMQEAYERMPYPGPPKYPMQVMPQGSAEFNQLMQFYSDENI